MNLLGHNCVHDAYIRSRQAAILLLLAHRHDQHSSLTTLPRDVVRLLAQKVSATHKDVQGWVYKVS